MIHNDEKDSAMAAPIQLNSMTAPIQVETSVETIDPATAARMLDANVNNRPLRKRVVDSYAEDMRAGRWIFNGEAIKIADDGTLLDGQHRLAAVVQSGVTVRIAVVRGLPRSAQESMDAGARRTAGDALSLRGEKHSHTVAAVARLILTQGDSVNRQVSNAEQVELINSDPALRWVVGSVVTGELAQLKYVAPTALIGYAYWRLHHVDSYACAEFFQRLATLSNLHAKSPILALHKKLIGHNTGSGYKGRREGLSMIFSAWNAWRKGEDRDFIRVHTNSKGHIVIPEPR
ncbi:MAG: hypothetical protein AVDCRST_MAG68-5133 [uncultured Gemmatimonadetes bacterium]|uniref:ParB/Sulfiredoxin domain-containing protein n=1 Tax=uncultured Gemmatimonadota bacterium TaxID=203437 RepID=A0A6J4MPI3_9BACT|nr:MAG: hypothetical protein AVDCRST_MAG68-5133 [uncultured Gemmatimonadota bacterium]